MFIFCDINTSVKLWDIQKAKKTLSFGSCFCYVFLTTSRVFISQFPACLYHNFPRVYNTTSRVFMTQLPACLWHNFPRVYNTTSQVFINTQNHFIFIWNNALTYWHCRCVCFHSNNKSLHMCVVTKPCFAVAVVFNN